ncbi:MAG: hypothetical protein KF752_20280 [Pirellulaceae bacterium]|nr:hypothetical protein [Pirellulaceae bacterium]
MLTTQTPSIARATSDDPILWPDGQRFALFLSHDIDQIYDREMWRILADGNHVRRMITQGEGGNVALALRRMARCIVWPRRTGEDFRVLLDIEAQYRFRSTYYVLHDPYWKRNGPRYGLDSAGLRGIIEQIKSANCEIGVHGGYYRYNNADAYRESRLAISDKFDVPVTGIRNHLLRFSYPETWRAQAAAGFSYDSTYGPYRQIGVADGHYFPFQPVDPATGHSMNLTVLPLSVMDVNLFSHLRLTGQQALEAAWKAIVPIIERGGLVSLLWHNNYFHEPEYADWQWVYHQLLDRCAQHQPWCATGAEIDSWCRQQWVNK